MNTFTVFFCYPRGSKFKARAIAASVSKALVLFAFGRSDYGDRIKIHGREYTLEYISWNRQWNSYSIYYTTKDDKLVRVSDHWCGRTSDGINHCLKIKNCRWSVDSINATEVSTRCDVRSFAGGIVSLRKIRLHGATK